MGKTGSGRKLLKQEVKEMQDLCKIVLVMRKKLSYFPTYRQIGIRANIPFQNAYNKIQRAITLRLAPEDVVDNYKRSVK
jgi:hypothetical protein